jgi:hypothetical protein
MSGSRQRRGSHVRMRGSSQDGQKTKPVSYSLTGFYLCTPPGLEPGTRIKSQLPTLDYAVVTMT